MLVQLRMGAIVRLSRLPLFFSIRRLVNKLSIVIFTAITLSMTACSTPEDVELWIDTNPYYGTLIISVQAVMNDVVVKDIIVNRGNCGFPDGTKTDLERTVQLSFGESYRAYSHQCSINDVLEVEVVTNNGHSFFDF
ncbi:hypothetical protein CWE09_13795 [Aliidiomarina minuta]|uniref:Uncharacterized protein n=1 Tax=Aliidiomarina minuta TaxID=880057 RepID=A0A432W197_9GAMM|nr:hypothetical protein CWE09_13795 [Aliidiomarina minuta]